MKFTVKASALVALLALSSTSLTACGDEAESPVSKSGTIKIAAPLPLSGPAAAYGEAYLEALNITVDKINKDGGIKSLDGRKIEILAADDEALPERGPELIRSMVDDGAVAAIGPIPSASVLATEAILDELQIPMLSPSLDDALTEQGSQYFFRMIQPAAVYATQMVDFLEAQISAGAIAPKKVAVVTMNVPPGTGARDGLMNSLKDLGVEVVDIEYDAKETRDFGPIVSELKDKGVDLVTGHMGPADQTLFVDALELQKWRPQSGFLWLSGGVAIGGGIKAMGPRITNWLVANYAGTQSSNEVTNQLAVDYEKATGNKLDALSAASPSIIGAIAAALEAIGEAGDDVTGSAIRDALRELSYESPENYLTFAGGVKFDDEGNNTEFQPVITQHDGKGNQTVVYPPEAAAAEPIWPAFK
jgi:branched-chain amino acid transport system substrate-binding protein